MGGKEGGGERRRRGEVWLDERMAAFTQRLVSPAETRLAPFRAEPSPSCSSSRPQRRRRARPPADFLSLGGGFFRVYIRFVASEPTLVEVVPVSPCPVPADHLCHSRRTQNSDYRARTRARASTKIPSLCFFEFLGITGWRLLAFFTPSPCSPLGKETLSRGWIPSPRAPWIGFTFERSR